MFSGYTDNDIKNVLIFRSSTRLFPLVLREIQKAFPSAMVDCCLPNNTPLDEEIRSKFRDVLHTTRSRGFRWRDISGFRKSFTDRSYDLALVLYNNEKGYNYLNVDAFALCVRAQTILTVNIKKEIHCLRKGEFLAKSVHRIGDLIWTAGNFLLHSVALLAILCAMLVSQPIIWTMQRLRKKERCD